MNAHNLWLLFRQDLTIALRNALVWFMLGTALLMIILIHFAIPAEFLPEQTVYYHDATEDKFIEAALAAETGSEQLLTSEADLEAAVAADQTAVGMLFAGTSQQPRVTLLSAGEISSEQMHLLQASLEQMLTGAPAVVPVQTLRPQSEPIPRNLATVPMLLTFEVLITGFMLVAVLMFQERQEGSIRAYRVSPGTVSGYILSKTLVFTLLGSVYGGVLVLATLGFAVNWPLLLAAIALGAALYTLIGMIVGVFFQNLSEWLVIGLAVLILNFLPMLSFALPTFAPTFITWIPSYPVVFGLAEIIFPTGASLAGLFIFLTVGIAVAYTVCHLLIQTKLMREGR